MRAGYRRRASVPRCTPLCVWGGARSWGLGCLGLPCAHSWPRKRRSLRLARPPVRPPARLHQARRKARQWRSPPALAMRRRSHPATATQRRNKDTLPCGAADRPPVARGASAGATVHIGPPPRHPCTRATEVNGRFSVSPALCLYSSTACGSHSAPSLATALACAVRRYYPPPSLCALSPPSATHMLGRRPYRHLPDTQDIVD